MFSKYLNDGRPWMFYTNSVANQEELLPFSIQCSSPEHTKSCYCMFRTVYSQTQRSHNRQSEKEFNADGQCMCVPKAKGQREIPSLWTKFLKFSLIFSLFFVQIPWVFPMTCNFSLIHMSGWETRIMTSNLKINCSFHPTHTQYHDPTFQIQCHGPTITILNPFSSEV